MNDQPNRPMPHVDIKIRKKKKWSAVPPIHVGVYMWSAIVVTHQKRKEKKNFPELKHKKTSRQKERKSLE